MKESKIFLIGTIILTLVTFSILGHVFLGNADFGLIMGIISSAVIIILNLEDDVKITKDALGTTKQKGDQI